MSEVIDTIPQSKLRNPLFNAIWSLDSSGNPVGLVGPDGEVVSKNLGQTNYRAGNGESLYVFNDHTAVTGISTPTLATSSTITWNEQPTVSVTVPSAGSACGVQIGGLSTPLRNKSIVLPVYIEDYTKVAKVQCYMSQDGALGSNYVHGTYNGMGDPGGMHKYNGWHLVELTENQMTTVGAGVTADGTDILTLRVDIQATAGNICTVYLGEARLNVRSRPQILFTFDDGRSSLWTAAYPILQKYNMVGTAYVIPLSLSATEITLLTEMQYAGWSVSNHAYHDGVGTDDSYGEIGLSAYIAQVEQCAVWLAAHGFTGGAHHAYVEGSYDGALVAALESSGIKTARHISGNTNTGQQSMCTSYGVFARHALMGGLQLYSGVAVATVETEIDRAIRDGRTLIITAHDIFSAGEGGAGATAYLDSDFETLVAYVADKRANGLCDVRSIEDWYSVLTTDQYPSD